MLFSLDTDSGSHLYWPFDKYTRYLNHCYTVTLTDSITDCKDPTLLSREVCPFCCYSDTERLYQVLCELPLCLTLSSFSPFLNTYGLNHSAFSEQVMTA